MWRMFQSLVYKFDFMGSQEWFLALIVVMIVGAVCLRGFGSRSGY